VFSRKVISNERSLRLSLFSPLTMSAIDLHSFSQFIASAMPLLALGLSVSLVSVASVVRVSVVRLVRIAPPGTRRR
jgi:hypothetical protein